MNDFWPAAWELTTLENIAQISTGCPYRTFEYPEDSLNEVRLINQIGEDTIELSEPKFMKISEREIVKYKLKDNDLIFAHRTSPRQLGKIVRFDLTGTVIHTANFLRIRPFEAVHSRLIEEVMKIYKLQGLFARLGSVHPNLQSLSVEQLKRVKVPMIDADALHNSQEFFALCKV